MSGCNNFVGSRPRHRFSEVVRVSLDFAGDPGVTKKSMAADCDINNILSRFNATGAISHINTRQGIYDFVEAVDFHTAMNIVREGERVFMELPASLRARFDNDPAMFLDFVTNPENSEEATKLGLVTPADPLPAGSQTPAAPVSGSAPASNAGASATPSAPSSAS